MELYLTTLLVKVQTREPPGMSRGVSRSSVGRPPRGTGGRADWTSPCTPGRGASTWCRTSPRWSRTAASAPAPTLSCAWRGRRRRVALLCYLDPLWAIFTVTLNVGGNLIRVM